MYRSQQKKLATQSREAPPNAVEVQFLSIAPENREASGRRFGELIHAALRDGGGAGVIEMNGRLLGATSAEIEAARVSVAAALGHPVFQNAAAAQRVHREYPVILPLEGNRVFEGVIDLAYFDGNSWTVVDFKTDASLGAKRKAYERQLQWYAHALHVIHGTPVRAVLLAL